ncbi:MAG: hypothetical protein ACI3ZK_07250 [Candidatus Cryptobacteroides sp.]
MNRAQNHTAVYPHEMRPTQYDGAHFLVYLNGIEADYKPDDDSESIPGISYSGNMEDGGTLIECDEWNRDKLINGIIRTKYLQTEEDAIKTHQIQLLQAKAGLEEGTLSEEKQDEYMQEWAEFQAFRQQAIDLVNSWDTWE